jgi:hypothetical protein
MSQQIVGELMASCTIPSLTCLECVTLYEYTLISLICLVVIDPLLKSLKTPVSGVDDINGRWDCGGSRVCNLGRHDDDGIGV